MSTPTSSRRVARGATQSPSNCTTPTRTSSFIEPKSEYLRNALEARRAKDATPSPVPAERPQPPPMQRRVTSQTASTDPWLEQAVSEDDIPPVPTHRRARRPSEPAMPRLPTQRELQSETERMKTAMFDLNLKLELLKKQNNELKDALDAANTRIEDLEPLEEANIDLREDNDRLALRMQNLEDNNAKLEDETHQLRNQNREVLQIQEETVAQMEQLQGALEEAADVIIRSEASNAELKAENEKLKEEMASSRSSGEYFSADATTDAFKKPPSRIYSVDESRPSTSHFDSDYYSQPDSPQVEPKRPSKEGLKFSDRAKNFLEINHIGKRSIQELKKRVSDISVKQAALQRSPAPEVPRIPEESPAEPVPRSIKRTPGRQRTQPHLQTSHLDGNYPPYVPSHSTPQTPTGPKDGLRELYRHAHPIEKPRSRPTTSSTKSPALSKMSYRSADSERNPFFNLPPRQSSRHAHTSSSNEQLRSETELSVPELAPELLNPPSLISEDLTVDLDRREQWWKDIEHYPSQKANGNGSRAAVSMATRAIQSRQPSMGGDFLFNMGESEEDFMARAHQGMTRRR